MTSLSLQELWKTAAVSSCLFLAGCFHPPTHPSLPSSPTALTSEQGSRTENPALNDLRTCVIHVARTSTPNAPIAGTLLADEPETPLMVATATKGSDTYYYVTSIVDGQFRATIDRGPTTPVTSGKPFPGLTFDSRGETITERPPLTPEQREQFRNAINGLKACAKAFLERMPKPTEAQEPAHGNRLASINAPTKALGSRYLRLLSA